ncbi:hypothetical protein N6H18_05850 [Reichenbachiella agarivorans]|uniref:HU domain-containing protein n=1 Tax=Reichenbachiella agarivorans TaxID=2979464 RepID=A0ABY6CU10_9BACT|nr:HU family DNA-binding protein [Reichenbachiella agarivorans]UXP33475.1 hypothetical protein N6H18_05850 [Reichenbachiella agarivorans]
MSIKYKVVSKRPAGIAGVNDPRYYPILTNRKVSDLDDVCRMISKRSTFNEADVIGVIHSLIDLIPELVMDGRNVKLDGLGIFSVHASAVGKQTPEEVSARDISKLKLAFLPSKKIKNELIKAEFKKVS